MSDKLFRWFKIIYAIQAGISAKELAERCEAEERTIYRDLRSLDVLAPITNEGYGKGYTFAGDFAMFPFNWREGGVGLPCSLPLSIRAICRRDSTRRMTRLWPLISAEEAGSGNSETCHGYYPDGVSAYREDAPTIYIKSFRPLWKKRRSPLYIIRRAGTNKRNGRSIRTTLVPRDQRFYLIGIAIRRRIFGPSVWAVSALWRWPAALSSAGTLTWRIIWRTPGRLNAARNKSISKWNSRRMSHDTSRRGDVRQTKNEGLAGRQFVVRGYLESRPGVYKLGSQYGPDAEILARYLTGNEWRNGLNDGASCMRE